MTSENWWRAGIAFPGLVFFAYGVLTLNPVAYACGAIPIAILMGGRN